MSAAALPVDKSVPTPRSPELPLTGPIPRHWFGNNILATHLVNGVSMLFPAGERFFVRSVKHYLDQIDDPHLRAQVKGFFGQEGRHAKEHDRWNEVLSSQGFSVAQFLSLYERLAYGVVERISSPGLRLATTAACEHYTALLAEKALRNRILDHSDPTMRALLLWHAAEEIEHRAVAFDVLQTVHPSYALRMAGLMMATACLGSFWIAASLLLLWQDPATSLRTLRENLGQIRTIRKKSGVHAAFIPGILAYLRRDFHPTQLALDQLAADYLLTAQLT